MNFIEFQKCPVNFILKFGTLMLTEKYFLSQTQISVILNLLLNFAEF